MVFLDKQDIDDICNRYRNGETIFNLYKEYKVSDRRLRRILVENGLKIRSNNITSYIENRNSKFNSSKNYIAISKIDGSTFTDYLNNGGNLTKHVCSKLNIQQPNLYFRKKYFMQHGEQWYDQWFDYKEIEEENKPTKKCPYCSWETTDIKNLSGAFEMHLLNEHHVTREQYLKRFPQDLDYFHKLKQKLEKEKFLSKKKNRVVCPICGKKMTGMTYSHLKYIHNMEFSEFKEKYPMFTTFSKTTQEKLAKCAEKANLHMTYNKYISKDEREVRDYITDELGFQTEFNRQVLIGKEIDILIPSAKIGIEYDGLKWHSEWFAHKDKNYHLDKTIKCNEKGYGLIHIFEDEYKHNKDLVLRKLKHILKVTTDEIKIGARKCTIQVIDCNTAKDFLNTYHIQGAANASVYYGAYYEDKLIGVMTFKKENKDGHWELTRYATDYHYICQGLGGKFFKHFIDEYKPIEVKSFADRRWTLTPDNNLYTKLGFVLDSATRPDYRYYNERVDRYKRFHKFGFRKQILNRKYGLPLSMTETEMVQKLGYDRIWDCGLFKYVWRASNE